MSHVLLFSICIGGVSTLVGAAREHGFVDGIGPKAQFNTPQGICIDERRNLLYVSDTVY